MIDLAVGAELFVYPRIPDFRELPPEAIRWQGEFTSRRFILPDPMLVNGIREYRTGDPQRNIHWGATAKTGRLEVKTHDYTVSPRLLVTLNTQISEDLWGMMEDDQREVIERGIRCCAAILAWASDREPKRVFCPTGADGRGGRNRFRRPGRVRAHLTLLLDTLAKLIVISG
jgi:uncharacterized protein (DUF58 family)